MLSLTERRSAAQALLVIAREAADLVLAGYRTGVAVEHKGTIDLVTRIDRASEDLLRARLAVALPGVDVIAEEHGGTATGDRPVVYADPLDGTTNYAHGLAYYCVTMALMEGGSLLAGVAVAPSLGVEYLAVLGAGATRNGVPCKVSRNSALTDSLLATGFPYDNRTDPENNLREFAELTLRTQGVRRCGSAALDLCMVADGTFDGYWERKLMPWDLAAGVLTVTEAGVPSRISTVVFPMCVWARSPRPMAISMQNCWPRWRTLADGHGFSRGE